MVICPDLHFFLLKLYRYYYITTSYLILGGAHAGYPMMQYNNWAIHHFHLESGMLNSDLLCYHEIGHNFQESWDSTSGYPGRWNPKGTGEVTNLIFVKWLRMR